MGARAIRSTVRPTSNLSGSGFFRKSKQAQDIADVAADNEEGGMEQEVAADNLELVLAAEEEKNEEA